MGVVYCAENIRNGYRYIGITVQQFDIRKKQHIISAFNPKSHEYNRPFKKALRDNSNIFKWYILKETDDLKELNQLEREYIREYRTYIGYSDCRGYNATLGGEGCSVLPCGLYRISSKDYTIVKRYKSRYEVLQDFGTMSNVVGCAIGLRDTAKGDVWYYEDTFNSMSQSEIIEDIDYRVNKYIQIIKNKIIHKWITFEEMLSFFNNDIENIYLNYKKLGLTRYKDFIDRNEVILTFRKKPIVQYSADGKKLNVFVSMHQAEKSTGVLRVSIVEVCEGRKKSAGGFQWRYVGSNLPINKEKLGRDRVIQKVSSYDLDGNYLKTFESVTEAGLYYGCDPSSISKVCRNKKNTTHNLIFRYGEGINHIKVKEKYQGNQCKGVVQICDGKEIYYESINDASRKTGYSSSAISRCCRGTLKLSNNVIFKFKF